MNRWNTLATLDIKSFLLEIAEMKRFKKSLFLIGFSIAFASFIASGLYFAEASDRKNLTKRGKDNTSLATSLLTEDFAYSEGALLTANGWSAHNAAGTNPLTVSAPGLTYSGYAGSGVGNSVAMATSGEDVNQLFSSPVSSGSVYAAFLVNVAATTATGDYFFHFHISGSSFYGKVFARKDSVTDNYSFGVSRNANAGTGAVYTPSSYTNGNTHLLVVKYTFIDGTANDTVELFVDPTPGAAEPAATLAATDFGAADVASIPGVGIRQGGASSASTQRIDGIRVATTWAEAVAVGGGGPTPSPTQKANTDMNGDGVTDYVITREIGASLTNAVQPRMNRTKGDRRMAQLTAKERRAADAASAVIPIEWWGSNNGASGGTNVVWGDSFFQDNIISADFDGDGADDVAIWRPGPPDTAAFYSINSSDLTYRVDAFGQDGDNTTIVGDYDGDGRDDSASFRCPELGSDPGQCYFFYRASSNNPTNGITYIPWGFGDSLTYYPYPGDFDGDGKHDFCLQAANPDAPQQAIFVLQLNDANYSQEFIHWGYSSDFLAPGDYDGDGRSDFTVVRNENRDGLDRRVFYILHRDGTTRGAEWGITDTDDIVPGDYDGDGAQDIAVYRWNSPEPRFWILPSNGDPHFTFQFGLTGDVPVATWYVQ